MAISNEERSDLTQYIGGTYMAALMGATPYMTPMDVFCYLTEKKPSGFAGMYADAGTALEPVVLQWFTEQTGLKVTKVDGVQVHPEYPYIGGHFDGMADDGNVVEAKSMIKAGNEIRVTDAHVIQCHTYMWITGTDMAHLVIYNFPDGRGERFSIVRDDSIIAEMERVSRFFWHENVLKDIPPEPTSDADSYLLQSLCTAVVSGKSVDVGSDAASRELLESWLAKKDEIAQLEAAVRAAKKDIGNLDLRVRAMFGDAEALVVDGSVVATYKTQYRAASQGSTSRVLRVVRG